MTRSLPSLLVPAVLAVLLSPAGAQDGLAELSIIEVTGDRRAGLFALLYSGAEGWGQLEQSLAAQLADRGVPVAGIDVRLYQKSPRTVEQLAADLGKLVNEYSQRWNAPKAALIGRSAGASLLPFAASRATAEARARITQLSLLSPDEHARLAGGPATVLPELTRYGPAALQCFVGKEEKSSPCRAAELQTAEVLEIDGTSALESDVQELARRILTGARRRAARQPLSRVRRQPAERRATPGSSDR